VRHAYRRGAFGAVTIAKKKKKRKELLLSNLTASLEGIALAGLQVRLRRQTCFARRPTCWFAVTRMFHAGDPTHQWWWIQ
jgi:hypothetical protein